VAVGCQQLDTGRSLCEHDIGRRHDVFGSVLAPTASREPPVRMAVVVECDCGYRLTDRERVARELDRIEEGTVKSPQLAVLTVDVDDGPCNQVIQGRWIAAIVGGVFHRSSFGSAAPHWVNAG
jgi:hypothetical protein